MSINGWKIYYRGPEHLYQIFNLYIWKCQFVFGYDKLINGYRFPLFGIYKID